MNTFIILYKTIKLDSSTIIAEKVWPLLKADSTIYSLPKNPGNGGTPARDRPAIKNVQPTTGCCFISPPRSAASFFPVR
jgi:hypothetical protein